MKPLKLEFSGLNSYRERQSVDFETLGRAGLFGIFGPTGSGKSSVLDAMTLALYGKADRAASGTRGIINQREKYAEVSLEFELAGTGYTVRRRYGRAEAHAEGVRAEGVRSLYAVLTRDDGSVLAEGADSVTRKVEELLGFTFSEFCRAVVLPQGKFADFLQLTGAARADMLGRIFDLEKFGEKLYSLAVLRRNQVQMSLANMEAAKAQLVDCSAEAIERAEEAVRRIEEEMEAKESEYAGVRQRYDESRRLGELFSRLRSAEKRKAELEAYAPEMEQKARILDAARRAEPLRDVIETVDRLAAERSEKERELRSVQDRLREAEQEFREATERLRSARDRKEREEPVLTDKRARLQMAVEKKREMDGLCLRKRETCDRLRALEGSLGEKRTSLDDMREALKSIEETVRSLEERQRTLFVDPDSRARVDRAVEELARLENASDNLESVGGELERKTQTTQDARSKALKIFDRLRTISASRFILDGDGELLTVEPPVPDVGGVSKGSELVSIAAREVEKARLLVRQARELLDDAKLRDRSALLAELLEEGKPCPVCGSLHHPAPAQRSPQRVRRIEEALRTLEKCEADLRNWEKDLQDASGRWDSAREFLEEVERKSEAAREEVAEAMRVFLAAAREALGDSYREGTEGEDVRNLRAEMGRRDAEYSRAGRNLEKYREEERRLRLEVERGDEELRKLETERNSAESGIALLEEEIAAAQAALDRMTGGEDPSSAMNAVESALFHLKVELEEAGKAEEEIRSRVEDLRKHVAGLEAGLESTSAELARQSEVLSSRLSWARFASPKEARAALLPATETADLERAISDYRDELMRVDGEIASLKDEIGPRTFSEEEFRELEAELGGLESRVKELHGELAGAKRELEALRESRAKWDELEERSKVEARRRDLADRLASLVRGKALVTFLAQEYLRDIAADASSRLGRLTGQRYALEVAEDGTFMIRDDFNGGARRSVGTLSGGEIFLTSLALALALSSKIQLRGRYPLGFFFLDEGFGTLDDEKLDAVITALEKLHDRDRMVGVISHVKELRERLACYLEVVPPRDDGTGSRVVMRTR